MMHVAIIFLLSCANLSQSFLMSTSKVMINNKRTTRSPVVVDNHRRNSIFICYNNKNNQHQLHDSGSDSDNTHSANNLFMNRRDVMFKPLLLTAGITSSTLIISPQSSLAAMKTTTSTLKTRKFSPYQRIPNTNSKIQIPKIGYSLYKTDPDQVQRGINIALNAGVRHFDIASLYKTNDIVGNTLLEYCYNGLPILDDKGILAITNNKEEIMQSTYDIHYSSLSSKSSSSSSSSFQKRRKELFITHKIQNDDQNVNKDIVKEKIIHEMKNNLKLSYIDMVMIHSPLTDKDRRIGTYKALVELKEQGLVHAIGVCHYSCSALGRFTILALK